LEDGSGRRHLTPRRREAGSGRVGTIASVAHFLTKDDENSSKGDHRRPRAAAVSDEGSEHPEAIAGPKSEVYGGGQGSPLGRRGSLALRSFGRLRLGLGGTDRRRRWRLRLTVAACIPLVAGCLLAVVMSSRAVVSQSLAAARSAPNLGRTKATAVNAKAGRTYTVTLAGTNSQRWLVVRDPYNPFRPCDGRCPHRGANAASALVGATVRSRSGACVARATIQGPTFNPETGVVAQRRLGQGLVASGTTFTAVAVPTWSGRVYLRLHPASGSRCRNARYTVRLTVQRALATGTVEADNSASAAQYSRSATTLEREQNICFHKGKALDHYTDSLTRQIRHASRRKIAQLRSAINAATRRYLATPCPPK
jgi:hypothetical protein